MRLLTEDINAIFMKTLSKHFSLLLFLSLFLACSSSSDEEDIIEETRELKLSVPTIETKSLETEDIDFEFEILDGNGEYTASASEVDGDPTAKVTIEGKKVTVNILVGYHLGSEITISDKKRQKATIRITSSHESLQVISSYGVLLPEGESCTMDEINFGAGAPYTLEKIRGNAAKAVVEDGKIRVTSLAIGDTYYKVRDKRGTVTRLTVNTSLHFEMDKTSNYLEIEGVNNLSATVTLQWGTEWEIVGSTDKITENLLVSRVLEPSGNLSDYYVLFIHTVDEGKGTDTITLKNKEGDLVVVKIHI